VGPVAGYFAKHSDVPLVVTPIDSDEKGMQFSIGLGVRKADKGFARVLEGVLDRERAAIDHILDDYGVPRVTDDKSAHRASL
jgi:mxaJ protein